MSYDFGGPEEQYFNHAETWRGLLGPLAGKPNLSFLELGSWKGRSAIWLLENVLTHSSSRLTCVDVWDVNLASPTNTVILQARQAGKPINAQECFLKNIKPFEHKVRVIKDLTTSALKNLAQEAAKFDFVYIDAGHLVEEVKADFLGVRPLLKANSQVFFDDYNWELNGIFTIREAIKQLGIYVVVLEGGAVFSCD